MTEEQIKQLFVEWWEASYPSALPNLQTLSIITAFSAHLADILMTADPQRPS